jgi:hypothetical protein
LRPCISKTLPGDSDLGTVGAGIMKLMFISTTHGDFFLYLYLSFCYYLALSSSAAHLITLNFTCYSFCSLVIWHQECNGIELMHVLHPELSFYFCFSHSQLHCCFELLFINLCASIIRYIYLNIYDVWLFLNKNQMDFLNRCRRKMTKLLKKNKTIVVWLTLTTGDTMLDKAFEIRNNCL